MSTFHLCYLIIPLRFPDFLFNGLVIYKNVKIVYAYLITSPRANPSSPTLSNLFASKPEEAVSFGLESDSNTHTHPFVKHKPTFRDDDDDGESSSEHSR